VHDKPPDELLLDELLEPELAVPLPLLDPLAEPPEAFPPPDPASEPPPLEQAAEQTTKTSPDIGRKRFMFSSPLPVSL
jgi:hypothetical protein